MIWSEGRKKFWSIGLEQNQEGAIFARAVKVMKDGRKEVIILIFRKLKGLN